MPYQQTQVPATVATGPGYFQKTPNAADLKVLEIKGNLERDRRKAAEERRHTVLAGGLQAERDVRMADIDAFHAHHQAGIQAERDARQAGYQSLAEQQSAENRGRLAQQQNEFSTEHAKLLDQFQQGHDYRQAGYKSQQDYQNAVYQAMHAEHQAGLTDTLHARQTERQGQQESALSEQRFGQQSQLQQQQGEIHSGQIDQNAMHAQISQMSHAQLTDWVNRNQFTRQHEEEKAKLERGIQNIQNRLDLSPRERADLVTEMQTRLNPLHNQLLGSQLATGELQRRALDDAHQSDATHQAATNQMMNRIGPDGTIRTRLPDGTEDVRVWDGRSAVVPPAIEHRRNLEALEREHALNRDATQFEHDTQREHAAGLQMERLQAQHRDRQDAHLLRSETTHASAMQRELDNPLSWPLRDPTQPQHATNNPRIQPAWTANPDAERQRRVEASMGLWNRLNPPPTQSSGAVQPPQPANAQGGAAGPQPGHGLRPAIDIQPGGAPADPNAGIMQRLQVPPPPAPLQAPTAGNREQADMHAPAQANAARIFNQMSFPTRATERLRGEGTSYRVGQLHDMLEQATNGNRGLTGEERDLYHHRLTELKDFVHDHPNEQPLPAAMQEGLRIPHPHNTWGNAETVQAQLERLQAAPRPRPSAQLMAGNVGSALIGRPYETTRSMMDILKNAADHGRGLTAVEKSRYERLRAELAPHRDVGFGRFHDDAELR